jgi:hypothetical protein
VRKERIQRTKFTEWMEANKRYLTARELTYRDFPTKFVWKKNGKIWKECKRVFAIGRLYYAYLASDERYYLRLLLSTVKGCISYKDIRTVHGVLYPTFKEACRALGFLDDDNEWINCIDEVAVWASGTQLRQLFTTILWHCGVTNPKRLWDYT